jgi:beta-lactam-binding protein with PASTA domain
MVRVPDVQGRLDADEVITAAGLKPKDIAVHGPIDDDAAGFMEAYRQRPAAGTLVKRGSHVTYRFWWESQ